MEEAPTKSMVANKNVSTRTNPNPIKVQKVVKQEKDVLRKVPRGVEVSRERRVYDTVNADKEEQIKIQGTKTLNQVLQRQVGHSHSHSNLSGNNPNLGLLNGEVIEATADLISGDSTDAASAASSSSSISTGRSYRSGYRSYGGYGRGYGGYGGYGRSGRRYGSGYSRKYW